MAATAQGARLTAAYHRRQLGVRAASMRDVRRLWELWDGETIVDYDRFARPASELIDARFRRGAQLAEDYYRAFRHVEGVSTGSAPSVLAEPPAAGRIVANLRITGLSGTLRARRAGLPLEAAKREGLSRAMGTTGRIVMRGGAETLIRSVASDPQAQGWRRVTSAKPCHFCSMLASRGTDYVSQDTASFQSHDHCSCTAEPNFGGADPPEIRDLRQEWERVTEGTDGAEARRVWRQHWAATRGNA